MKEPKFFKDVYSAYMIIEKEESDREEICIYEENLLNQNTIQGLLSLKIEGMGNKLNYYYDIWHKQPLKGCVLEYNLTSTRIKQLLKDIVSLIKRLEAYLLEPDSLRLSEDSIFVCDDGQHFEFAYVPGSKNNFDEQMLALVEWLMGHINHEDKEAVTLVYGLYKGLNDKKPVTELIDKLDEKDNRRSEHEKIRRIQAVREPELKERQEEKRAQENTTESEISVKFLVITSIAAAGAMAAAIILNQALRIQVKRMTGFILPAFILPALTAAMGIAAVSVAVIYYKKQKADEDEDFWAPHDIPEAVKQIRQNETTLLYVEEDMQTRLLQQDKLILKGHGICPETVYVSAFPFVIGKQHEDVQFALERDVVSRRHARLDKNKDGYFITDLNSTNGTFLNSRPLAPQTAYPLKNGDVLQLADVLFKVELVEAV